MEATLAVGSLDVTLTATYVEGFTLAISSTGASNVPFTVGGVAATTPYSQTLQTGSYLVTMPATSGGKQFSQWSDGDTNLTKTISLTVDTTLAVVYVSAPPPTVNLMVAAGADGSVSPVGNQVLTIGQSYSFTAIPNPGYQLDHWDLSGTSVGSSNPLPLTATTTMAGQTLTALFTPLPLTQITLTLNSSGNGTTNPTVGQHTLNVGDTVTFQATPAQGYAFTKWILGTTTYTANPLQLQITAAMNGQTLTAQFASSPPPPPSNVPIWLVALTVLGIAAMTL